MRWIGRSAGFRTCQCLPGRSGIAFLELLVDSDIFIDHLRGAHRFEVPDGRTYYSVVTRCELFAGSYTDEAEVNALLDPIRELTVDRKIAEAAGRLRRSSQMRTADAIIAATALTHGLTLFTRNTRHFEGVSGLHVRTRSDRNFMEDPS
ncbi:MAG TPA: PIN domain-containing protein [Chloroflexota bacterium]|jgi:predicted nucleic acid-binding protein|nr:PIN domain-containing protein [Chloroflexota bacterium]